jgi:DNA polymerase kappa
VDLTLDLRRADEYIAELELSRDLSQTVVHIDCDAFYAAVEELDRPELKHVPMAVGKGVLTTCNYHARKFGCRSGMAGFVAMKLCPNLTCLPLNFAKYTAKAQEVREILADYDPRFESASIDEAYLNITEYCEEKGMDPEEAVTQLRNDVCEKTHITISAGIAPNAKIAKIASNRNKPNGQFRVANDRATILAFMRDLPTRKVNGVGRVFERELDAVGVKTCGDIYPQRAYLSKLFGEKAFQFLMQCYLGLGRTKVQPAEEYERKSVGTESTFHDMSDKTELREKLRWTAEELEKDLIRTQFKGRTLVLKIKLHTYEVLTRQTIPPKAVSTADDLYTYSLPMMAKLEKEIPGMKLRLMGLRCTHLVSTKKTGIDFFGMRQISADSEAGPSGTKVDENGEWEVWPDEEFEEAARQERQDEMNELERLSQEQQLGEDMAVLDPLTQEQQLEESNRRHKHGREILPNPTPKKQTTSNIRELGPSVGFQKPASGYLPPPKEEKPWTCPICARPQSASAKDFNDHIDYCLSRQTIKEAVRGTSPSPPVLERQVSEGGGKENGHNHSYPNKRGRPLGKRKGEPAVGERGHKKLFFGVQGR